MLVPDRAPQEPYFAQLSRPANLIGPARLLSEKPMPILYEELHLGRISEPRAALQIHDICIQRSPM